MAPKEPIKVELNGDMAQQFNESQFGDEEDYWDDYYAGYEDDGPLASDSWDGDQYEEF